MSADIIELVRKAREGNAVAFGELYEQYSKEMYRYALTVVGDPDAAQDAVSEAVLDAFKGIGSLKNENSFKGWLFRILNAACRRQYNDFHKNLQFEDYYNETGSGGIDKTDLSLDMENALKHLTQEERQIVLMKTVYGMSSKEMSETLNLPDGTIRSKLKRSLDKLRQNLGKEGYEYD